MATTTSHYHVVEKLRSGQLTLERLETKYKIKVTHHPDGAPLVILNYQTRSPKIAPIARECRSLVLEKGSWNVVARSFDRFFNWGEASRREQEEFNFENFRVDSKEDGSLVTIYHYAGTWHLNTRSVFASAASNQIQLPGRKTYCGVACEALGVKNLSELNLEKEYSYVFELASPYNKVVRQYYDPTMYLLAVFDTFSGTEVSPAEVDHIALAIGASRPTSFDFKSMDEIDAFIRAQMNADATFEGVVIRDDASRRWKIKNPAFLLLNKCNGDKSRSGVNMNLLDPKNLLPFILQGEGGEFLSCYPEVKPKYKEVEAVVKQELDKLLWVWDDCRHIKNQKDFAVAVNRHETGSRFANCLFTVRSKGGTRGDVKAAFLSVDNVDYINKVLFK